MVGDVTARAQTVQELDQAARTLKRHIRESREVLGAVRRAQAMVTGIEVETIQSQPEGGHSGHNQVSPEDC